MSWTEPLLALLLAQDGPADLLRRESVCVTAVQSVNDKEESDVMGERIVADTGDERGGKTERS